MGLGLSLDSLTSVYPVRTVKRVMPGSMTVYYSSGSWDPLKLHHTNDAHLSGPGRASFAHSIPRAHVILPDLLPGDEGRR